MIIIEGELMAIRASEFQGKTKYAFDFLEGDAKGGLVVVRINLPDGFKTAEYMERQNYRVPVFFAVTPSGAMSWRLDAEGLEQLKRQGQADVKPAAANGRGRADPMASMGSKTAEQPRA
jgi:hypothetical protein